MVSHNQVGVGKRSAALAGAAFDLMTSPETVAKAKAEFKKRLGAEGYKPLLEKDQKPPLDYRLPARKAAGGE